MKDQKDKREKEPYWIGHRERLRNRAASEGFTSMRPHEIIEMVLFYAVPRVDLTDVSRALIGALGSVEGVMKANREQLLAVPGVTGAMADWLLMTSELLEAYSDVEQDHQYRVWCFKDMLELINLRWRDVTPPQVWVVYADYDDRLLCHMQLTDSLYWIDAGCFREIMECALAMEARYVYLLAFAGVELSERCDVDEQYLKLLSDALDTIDVKLMDFIIIDEAGVFSMRVNGRLEAVDQSPRSGRLRERYCGEKDDV